MRGHIRERSPGRFAIILDSHDPATGKRQRKWHKFAGTKRQAQIETSRLISAQQAGTYVSPDKVTLAQYLDKWLAHVAAQVSGRSIERYREIVHANIVPVLGGVTLSKLQPMQISEAYATLLRQGRRDGKGGLSARSVHHIHTVLKAALRQTVRWRVLPYSPMDAVTAPRVERRQVSTYTMGEIVELLDAVRGTPVHIPAVLAALCGLRRAETCALKWSAVNLTAGTLSVIASIEQTKGKVRVKSPKSGKGRSVVLPAAVVGELRLHRLQQAQSLLRVGVRLSDDTYVTALPDGSMLRPNTLTIYWARFIATAPGLPRLTFHSLRHSHATMMLASGIHPKIASERLGHSRIAVTLDTYSHVVPAMQSEAVAVIDAAYQAAKNKRA